MIWDAASIVGGAVAGALAATGLGLHGWAAAGLVFAGAAAGAALRVLVVEWADR